MLLLPDSIADTFRDFVTVHQSLLNTLIGKAGLFTAVPLVGAPVASVLRQVESIVDVSEATSVSVSEWPLC